jgi:predicted nucleic acid-binding protein
MTLLDASLLIDFLRTKDLHLLAQMNSVGGAICGVTRAEILSGSQSAGDRAKLVTILDGFQQTVITQAMWDEVGDVQSRLRANGITIPLADAVLTTIGLSLDVEVWARDVHYKSAQQVFPAIRLFQESP